MLPKHVFTVIFLAAASCTSASVANAQQTAQSRFERGYFLQTHERDSAAAAEAFETVVDDGSAPQALRDKARRRLAQCREDLASADLARLMPPDAMAYVEVVDPGRHVDNVLSMLGLSGEFPSTEASPPHVVKIEDGIYFPDDFAVSPHLVDEIGKIKGVAAAVTSVNPRGEPAGVVAIHPGDSGLLRGLLETGVQVLKPESPIAGFRTYRIEEIDVLITVTRRLFFVARSRAHLEGAVARLTNTDAESLATQDGFQKVQSNRSGALLFAYVDGQRALTALEPLFRDEEAMAVRTLLDLDHLNSASVSLKTTEESIEASLNVDLAEGHRNLVYSLFRTAPITRRSLDHVPGGAAGLAIIGLNPPGAGISQPESADAHQYMSLMDVGREIFSNIEEVSLFVLPADSASAEFPNVGLVFTAKDPSRSEALWTQLLSIPALVAPKEVPAPTEVEIAGRTGKQYRFPEVPPIVVLKAEDGAIVGGTRGAVEAAVRATSGGPTIASDEGFRPLLDSLSPQSSKAVLVHVGRAVEIAAGLAGGSEAAELRQIGRLIGDMKVLVVTDEQPTHFTLRAAATGLPDVPSLVRALIGDQSAGLSDSAAER